MDKEQQIREGNYSFEECKTVTIKFASFCGNSTLSFDGEKWRMNTLHPTFKTTEELLTLYLENAEQN